MRFPPISDIPISDIPLNADLSRIKRSGGLESGRREQEGELPVQAVEPEVEDRRRALAVRGFVLENRKVGVVGREYAMRSLGATEIGRKDFEPI